MSEEKDFDDILRSKFEEQSFPFDEGNWDEAEEMIDRQRRKEKRRRRFILFFIGIMTGIGIALPFFYSLNNSVAENKVISKNAKETNNDSMTNNGEDKKTADDSDSTKKENIELENDYYQESEIKKIKTDKSESTTQLDLDGKNEKQSKHKTKEQTNKKDSSSIPKFKTDQLKKNNSDYLISSETKKEQKDPKQKEDPLKETVKQNDSTKKTESNPSSSELKNNSENLTVIHSESLIAHSIDSTELANLDSTENKKDSTITSNDSVVTTIPTNETALVFTKAQKIGIFGGAVYNKGWNYNDTLDGNGFSPSIGVNYHIHFKPKFSFSMGLNYQFTGNLNYSYKNSISHQPGFGLNDSIQKYSLKRNHYMVIPVMMYFVAKKNQFGLGASFSYLFSSLSDIHIIRQTNSTTEIVSTEKGRNYMEGFNRMDVSLNISYRRKLNSKLDFITEINFGLFDQKNNSYFTNSNSSFERNIYFRSGLTFNIFGL